MTTDVNMPEVPVPQSERAILDFLKVLKASEQRYRVPRVREEFQERAKDWERDHYRRPQTLDEVDEVMSSSVSWQFDRALARFSQELMYNRARAVMSEKRRELQSFLSEPVARPIGSLRLNPSVPIPQYYAADYHVQPGGMDREPLMPFISNNLTNKVYFGGSNDSFEQQRKVAELCPDGPWQRILDLGCGAKSTVPLKERFPNAEVHGIDLSAPLLQYSHKYAEAHGLAIHFSQQNAERTDFPDNHFDVVSSWILFHEIPDAAAYNVIREGFRVLRPGGWFVIGDTAPYRTLDPFTRYFTDWQTGNNVEPFWREAGLRNYPEVLRQTGFVNISDPSDNGPVVGRVSPWVTKAQKPGGR